MHDAPTPMILIVEQDQQDRATLSSAFAEAGFAIMAVASAEEALGLALMDVPVSALVTGLELDGALDGWALGESLREMCGDLPVVYLSQGDQGLAGLRVPGGVVVPKPYRAASVCALIERLISFDPRLCVEPPPSRSAPARPRLRLIA